MDDSKGFYAMEYVDGPTLAQLFTERRPSRNEALEICLRLCDAMGAAHRAGIIHRDLKLTNVMMDGAGEPRVVDFGLARLVRGGEETWSLLTFDGQVLGTPMYMSPEQALGRQSQVGPSSDVYALGVMLYWMLTGVFPRSDAMAPLELLRRAAKGHIVPPNEVLQDLDPRLERILLRSLAPRRDDRFADADEMAAALRQYIDEGTATN
jgi:serine/threonine protein kinase